ncbi:hypothetical protein MANES_03G047400v8 [Manihot esculenta]|uniref:Uncharacterized protein n=1 Tax=Manihot esculenta TaxID=3983 RepID=A0A2C9W628_MANES|nr:hypothetical protein MANES_03G047400v8 [Manihot esculenta]
MVLRRPAMNRRLNRENPDILIVIIAVRQKMKGGKDDKERVGRMGPQKPATEMSDTAQRVICFPLLSFSLFLLFVWRFFLYLSLSILKLNGSISCISHFTAEAFLAFWLSLSCL